MEIANDAKIFFSFSMCKLHIGRLQNLHNPIYTSCFYHVHIKQVNIGADTIKLVNVTTSFFTHSVTSVQSIRVPILLRVTKDIYISQVTLLQYVPIRNHVSARSTVFEATYLKALLYKNCSGIINHFNAQKRGSPGRAKKVYLDMEDSYCKQF